VFFSIWLELVNNGLLTQIKEYSLPILATRHNIVLTGWTDVKVKDARLSAQMSWIGFILSKLLKRIFLGIVFTWFLGLSLFNKLIRKIKHTLFKFRIDAFVFLFFTNIAGILLDLFGDLALEIIKVGGLLCHLSLHLLLLFK